MNMAIHGDPAPGFQLRQAVAGLFPQPAPHRSPQRPVGHDAPAAARTDGRLDVPLSELTFRHLQNTSEISSIMHLRKEIQLVAASVDDPGFAAREKKEMNRVLWPLSSAAAHL